MTDQFFKNDAKQLVDMLFNNKLFVDTLSRDDMNSIEELLSYTMQSKFESHMRAKELFDKIQKTKTYNQ